MRGVITPMVGTAMERLFTSNPGVQFDAAAWEEFTQLNEMMAMNCIDETFIELQNARSDVVDERLVRSQKFESFSDKCRNNFGGGHGGGHYGGGGGGGGGGNFGGRGGRGNNFNNYNNNNNPEEEEEVAAATAARRWRLRRPRRGRSNAQKYAPSVREQNNHLYLRKAVSNETPSTSACSPPCLKFATLVMEKIMRNGNGRCGQRPKRRRVFHGHH